LRSQTGSCIATLARHEYAIGALAWLPDGRGFVSGGMDSKLFFWVRTLPLSPSSSTSPS